MAQNPAAYYGRDVRCFSDADAMFSDVTGLDVLRQDIYHRLTTDNILGPNGDGWGFDVRRLLGYPTADLPGLQPQLSEVCQRDPRVRAADVAITPSPGGGLKTIRIDVTIYTAAGPFALILSVNALTVEVLANQ